FNSFYPMEVIAKALEVKALEKKYPSKKYLVFPEDRIHPIKMRHDLPQRWMIKGPTSDFTGEADKGENFAYQLGVYPVSQNLEDVTVAFSDLKDAKGNIISSKTMSCLNTSGIDYKGNPFRKKVNVLKGAVQAMWCLVNIPKTIVPGTYTGTAVVKAKGMAATVVRIALKVSDKLSPKGGINDPQKQTRLTWLNSTMAQQNDVIKPYIPLAVKDERISLLGRKVILDKTGFPKHIETFFTPEMTEKTDHPKEVLNQPISFMLETSDGKKVLWEPKGVRFTQKTPGTVKWQAQNTAPGLQMDVTGSIEFDGFVAYTVKVTALRDISFNDLRLYIPYNKKSATYMMGLNLKGEKRPETYEWKWDVANKNQDGAWIGDVNAGLQYSLRDEHYVRPLNTNFYLQRPLILPTSWGNDNKGGIRITEADSTVWVNNYSGARTMKKGEVLYYNFNLLITPFHVINTDFQWSTRFFHKYADLDSIKATGATVVNIHHGTPINPYINYPFIEHDAMKAYINRAHQLGLKVKIYNTIRELSNRCYELYALRSLGNEVYSDGKGGGYSWLQEHIGDDYIAAWFVPEYKDAAII
ncbi:MAG TPA: glycoside hydrolase domain-containing protein, partial [Mucilaginibacter sp.]|nr:glycoside hydrolase domain-containing protein [Mucilaginibacter sp.]